MVDSDLEINQQSQTWADTDIDNEMGELNEEEMQDLLEMLGEKPKFNRRMNRHKKKKVVVPKIDYENE